MITLPVAYERELGVFRWQLLKGASALCARALEGSSTLRQDAEGDPEIPPDLEDLLLLLGLSIGSLVDQDKLRARLRALAQNLSSQKQAELTRLLGRMVPAPNARTLESWVEDQAEAITAEVNAWLARANEAVVSGLQRGRSPEELRAELAESSDRTGRGAAFAASAAVLALNAELVSEISQSTGSTHYRWVTENDSRVRENHRLLHNTIQRWDDPPMGGGTKPGDRGAPGSGWGCRCLSVPIPAEAAPQVSVSITFPLTGEQILGESSS